MVALLVEHLAEELETCTCNHGRESKYWGGVFDRSNRDRKKKKKQTWGRHLTLQAGPRGKKKSNALSPHLIAVSSSCPSYDVIGSLGTGTSDSSLLHSLVPAMIFK